MQRSHKITIIVLCLTNVALCPGGHYRDHNLGWFRREVVTHCGRMRGGELWRRVGIKTDYLPHGRLTCLNGQRRDDAPRGRCNPDPGVR